MVRGLIIGYISDHFFENPRSSENQSNKGRGKEKKKKRGEGKEEKKTSNSCTLSFYNSYL